MEDRECGADGGEESHPKMGVSQYLFL